MERTRERFEDRGDAELIRLARNEPEAFGQLFERHARALESWLFAKTRDSTAAIELVAETFAQAWRSAPRFRGEDDREATAWLFGIARNLALQYYKRQRVQNRARRRIGMRSEIDLADLEDVDRRIDDRQLSAPVREAFAELSAAQREAIRYRVVDELSYAETAARLGIDTATARTRVFRGLEALRATIRGTQP